MKTEFDNLSAPVRKAINEDLETVKRLATARGVTIPDVRVCIIALENEGVPPNLPKHKVRKPSKEISVSFKERCDWESQRQSFQLIQDQDCIWVIGGGNEGAMYGFGEVLRCLTGVIWAGVKDEHTLFGPKQSLPKTIQKPSFPYRAKDGASPDKTEYNEFVRWLNRNRFNAKVHSVQWWAKYSHNQIEEFLNLYKERCIHLIVGYHAMNYFLPEEEFAKHPDWFGMRNGQHVQKAYVELPECPHLNAEIDIQPCLSNRELVEYITDRMAAQVNQCSDIEIFSVWPHDGINNWCQCPECTKKTPYEHMYNLAITLEKKIPVRVPIELIVYANLLTVPRNKLPYSDRIISMLCPYLRHYTHRFYDRGGPELVMSTLYPKPDRINPVDDRDYGKLFRKWSKVWKETGSTPGIFEYGGNLWSDESRRVERQRFLYHPSNKLRYDEARWYKKHGVRYFYVCSNFEVWPDAVHMLAFPRSLWNCDESWELFEKQYYTALTGKRGMALRKALKSVADYLLADKTPMKALKQLETLLSSLPSKPFVSRYQLWSEYIKLAWPSHEAERAGRFEEAIEHEKRVQTFFERCAKELEAFIRPRSLISYSKIKQQRLQEWQNNMKGTDYRL